MDPLKTQQTHTFVFLFLFLGGGVGEADRGGDGNYRVKGAAENLATKCKFN